MTSRRQDLERALDALGLGYLSDPFTELDSQAEALQALYLANAVLGAAEAHLVGAEMDATKAGVDLDEVGEAAEAYSDATHAGTPLAERRLLLFSLRATRLLRALERDQPDDATTDPVLAAARDAVGLATALISYRQAAEHMEDQLPEEFLQMTTVLFRRIGEALVRLSS